MKYRFVLNLILLLFISTALNGDRREDFELLGAVKDVKNFRAAFFFRYGSWELSPFFPYSSLIGRTADRLFDSDGYCLRALYLKPDGESRYTAAASRGEQGRMEKVCYDYLSDEGERFLLRYDEIGRITQQKWIRTGDKIYDTRYFIYDQQLLREEAYGTTGHLYEKVFYHYDGAGRLVRKEVKGYPYDMQLRREEYRYDKGGKLSTESHYRFDQKLVRKNFFFYDESGRLKEKISHQIEGTEVSKQIFRYEWRFDVQGNWVERIEIEILKKHDRWVEEPRFFYRREISYH